MSCFYYAGDRNLLFDNSLFLLPKKVQNHYKDLVYILELNFLILLSAVNSCYSTVKVLSHRTNRLLCFLGKNYTEYEYLRIQLCQLFLFIQVYKKKGGAPPPPQLTLTTIQLIISPFYLCDFSYSRSKHLLLSYTICRGAPIPQPLYIQCLEVRIKHKPTNIIKVI